MHNKKPNIDIETLQLMYDEIKKQLNLQSEAIKMLESKAGTFIGFIGIVIGFGINLGKYFLDNKIFFSSTNTIIFLLFYSFGMISFLISICLAVSTFQVKGYRVDPDPKGLVKNYFYCTKPKVMEQLLDNYVCSYEANLNNVYKKAKKFKNSLYCFIFGLISIVIYMIALLFYNLIYL